MNIILHQPNAKLRIFINLEVFVDSANFQKHTSPNPKSGAEPGTLRMTGVTDVIFPCFRPRLRLIILIFPCFVCLFQNTEENPKSAGSAIAQDVVKNCLAIVGPKFIVVIKEKNDFAK